MKKLYCGGTFPFDFQNENYIEQVRCDYRAQLLGSEEKLLERSNGVLLRDGLWYIGPFYFESDGMLDSDIVAAESHMVETCTHAIFLLDDGCCPGTITELTMASLLGKEVRIFYIRKPDKEETESTLHSPCWYPIVFSHLKNPHTAIFCCTSKEDATARILAYVKTL